VAVFRFISVTYYLFLLNCVWNSTPHAFVPATWTHSLVLKTEQYTTQSYFRAFLFSSDI